MDGAERGVPGILRALEAAAPVDAVRVFAEELARQVSARQVSLLVADLGGSRLVRLTRSGEQGAGDRAAEQVPISDDHLPYARAMVTQQIQVVPEGGTDRVLVPVTTRGDAMGVLELVLPGRADPGVLGLLGDAAHALALAITAERRHTDLYEWGQRSTPLVLAAEIQRRLLPDAFTCEGGSFTLAAWLEPAGNVGGDTYDYSLDRSRLALSITDAMGHEVEAALLATLAVSSLRNSRRAGDDLATTASDASRAVEEHRQEYGFVTGLVMAVDLASGGVDVVNAGHPLPLLQRGGVVREVPLLADPPFGVRPSVPYRLQHFDLLPGDRLVLLTDGMLERNAAGLDLPSLVAASADQHPRQLIQTLTAAVERAAGGDLRDDATAMCLQWHGPR